MATTARRSNRYPALGDTPDVPRDIGFLAADLDDAPAYNRGTAAARPTNGRFIGDIWWVTNDFTMSTLGTPTVWDGVAWQYWTPPANPAVGVVGSRSLGYGATQALPGNDPTVTNARTPLAHAASHLQGGSDKIHGIVPLLGMIDYWGGTDPADTDWMVPDGRALNATADPTLLPLWNAIGTAHGGTGIANFFLPNPRGRFMIMQGTASPAVAGGTAHTIGQKGGEEAHTIAAAEMPQHVHYHYSPVGGNFGGGTSDPVPVAPNSIPAFTAVGGVAGAYSFSHVEPGLGGAYRLNPGSVQSTELWQIQSTGFQVAGTPSAAPWMPPFMTCNKLMRVR